MEKTDPELIHMYLEGNEESLKTLISRHIKLVYNFTYRISGSKEEANDITQETFVKIWKNLKKYDPEKKFTTWLLAIARNTSLDWLKKKKAVVFSDIDRTGEAGDGKKTSFEENISDTDPLPDAIFEKIEDGERLRDGLAKLPFHYRDVIVLHTYEGLTFAEIAEMTKKPLNTVKSNYRRGIELLRKVIDAPKQTL